MRSRQSFVLALAVLVATSCTPPRDESPAAHPTPSEGEPAALVASLPDVCGGFGRVHRRGEITFARGNSMYAVTSNGSRVRCIGTYEEGSRGQWGGLGDRLFLQTSTGGRVAFSDEVFPVSPDDTDPVAYGLSRPTGTSVLFTSGNKRHLYKMSANGKDQEDISFLRRHDDVVYHPAGMHIVAVGVDEDGTYGIHIATNAGKERHLLVLSEDAKRVYSLSFSSSGELFYAAEHENRYDVHSVALQGGPTGDVLAGGLGTHYTSDFPITKAVVSQFRPSPIAIQVGTSVGNSCPGETLVSKGRKTTVLEAGLPTEPVGWLPNGDLAYVSLDQSCDISQALHVWDGEEEHLVVEAPTAVAIRGILPDPPDPPTKVPEVIA